MRLEENPTFLILYLNVNLERHLVVIHHDDFDRTMVHIPVQVNHFVEKIQTLQRPLTTLSRNHIVENNANCLDGNVFVAKLGPHVLLFDDRSIPEINKKHQNFFKCNRTILEWSVAQNSTPIPLTVIPPEQNLIKNKVAGELGEVLRGNIGVDGEVLHAVGTLLLNTEKVEKQTRKNK